MTEQVEDFVKFKAADDQISNTLDQEVARSNSLHTIREQEESEKNKKRYEYAEAFITTAWVSMVFVALLLIADGLEFEPFQLSNSVMLGILGTALANVLAPVYLLARSAL